MSQGRLTTLHVSLTSQERRTLEAWQRAQAIPAGQARRGRILLLLEEGLPVSQVAARVGISRRFVYKWVQRFLAEGLEGLVDKPGRGSRSGQRRSPLAMPPDSFPRGNGAQGK